MDKTQNEIIKTAAEIIRKGQIVVYPTDTVYGIGGDATSEEVVRKVYEIKRRPMNMPISVLVSDFEMLEKYAEINEEQMAILKKFLPGPFTFILKPKIRLFVSRGTVGFRIPNHWCTLIVKEFGKPITTTSANIHQQTTPDNIEKIRDNFKESVSLYIDEGTLEGKPSKVVDLIDRLKVIRE
ncbi:MAG: L-threonylcarbamoyladenylate synthase [Candidatus Aenigmatarchaeota archaeon]